MFNSRIRICIFSLLALFFFLATNLESIEFNSTLIKKFQTHSIGMTELKLSNGMTCYLKPANSDTDEVFFKLAALGGFASLSQEDYVSGKLADEIAWESGLGKKTSDQMSVFLYENFLEFTPKIYPFSRTVLGEGSEQSIEAFFQCAYLLFTKQQFTKEGLKAATTLSRETLTKLNNDTDYLFESQFLEANTQNFSALSPIKIEDLNRVNFEIAKQFFHRCFSDPSEFVFVITGNFKLEKVIKFIEKYLASIPQTTKISGLKQIFSAPFPNGITEKTIKIEKQSSCLTYLTFPLQIEINERSIKEIAFMCQIIEARLRRLIMEKMNFSYGVDVSYEFPLYPLLNNPWISIRYRCEDKFMKILSTLILNECEHLQSKGTTLEEVENIKLLEDNIQNFWLSDDFYWVSMLTNYYLWQWDPKNIDSKNALTQNMNVEKLNTLLREVISLKNYSLISSFTK